jgi:hypothetical protein
MRLGAGESGRLSVFKGRKARLNRAIFHILALIGQLTIYGIHKEVKAQKGLRHTEYTNVNRRVRILEEHSCLEKIGTRKTQAGFQAVLYQLSLRIYLALLLSEISLDSFIQKGDEPAIVSMLTALISLT